MPVWDPRTYLEFADERSRPFVDLLSRVGAANPQVVVDLGCGPGQLTASLADRWPRAQILGLDSSPEMITQKACDLEHGQGCWPGEIQRPSVMRPIAGEDRNGNLSNVGLCH